jgi:lysozyme family protein
MIDPTVEIDALITREGGFVDHPSDRGGPTRYGITAAVAARHGWHGDMKQFPRSKAFEIYEEDYWTRPGFDRVAALFPKVAGELFDTGVNMGVGVAAGFLQRLLNALNRQGRDYADIEVDHDIGGQTLKALARFRETRGAHGEAVLLTGLQCLQGERYIDLAEKRPANEDFVYGWLTHRV